MMGLGNPQRLAKFEVASFIYYGNIRKVVVKTSDKPKWGNPLFWGETDFTVGFADLMFPIQCDTFMELRLQQMGDFYKKTGFYNGKFLILGACKVGVENCCTKLPKVSK